MHQIQFRLECLQHSPDPGLAGTAGFERPTSKGRGKGGGKDERGGMGRVKKGESPWKRGKGKGKGGQDRRREERRGEARGV